ncbi:hypothetical protein G7054_g8452 [Neopestalotiopsis clavispora]|nr:hypothetical protein G7054_g8452 [Neopestalotiopsis clavispora]
MAEREITEDYYEILQVQPKATGDEIKASYRRLALLKHPDKNADNPNATAEFQQATYQCLSDPRKRSAYDNKRVEAREDLNRRARTGENEINLLKRKISYLRKTLEDLTSRHSEMFLFRNAYKRELADIVRKALSNSYGDPSTMQTTEAWWQTVYRAISNQDTSSRQKDPKQTAAHISELRSNIAALNSELLELEIRILETETVLSILAGETRRQQWPAPPRTQTARQAEAERMQAEQRRRYASAQQSMNQEREAGREAQRAAAQAKQATRREEQSAKEAARAKMADCGHESFWKKVDGRHACKNCFKASDRAFSCPSCGVVVCKRCRNALNHRKKES